MPLNATTLRQLLAVDSALQPVHHAIDWALASLSKIHDLDGLAGLVEALRACQTVLHEVHPVERYVAELQAERARQLIDLATPDAGHGEPTVLPFVRPGDGPDAIDLHD
jgi:hypothetical protein